MVGDAVADGVREGVAERVLVLDGDSVGVTEDVLLGDCVCVGDDEGVALWEMVGATKRKGALCSGFQGGGRSCAEIKFFRPAETFPQHITA